MDFNATRAYKVAYPSCKKEETINAAASRMVRNVKVKEHIDKRMKDREGCTEITQDKVLKELAKIGYVYFTEPEVDVDDIKTKVHIAELFIPASQRSIYYWLRQARQIFSIERGLRF